jgi:sarcosine/dimethylglycine N-methyltransferase
MTTVRELYESFARDGELDAGLGESLEPRGKEWLFELFAALRPQPGQVVVDVGARDGRHVTRLVREHDLRGVAVDPVPHHVELAREAAAGLDIEVVEAAIEALPLADASADWIWCRDVLVHVDVERGLAECARVLKPGGAMLAYVTLATDMLEPREAAWLADTCALVNLDGGRLERAAADAGLALAERVELGGEWRERMIEDGDWDPAEALLRLSRLRRSGASGTDAETYAANKLWGVYQLIGKLCPTVYVWEKRG